MSAKVEGAFRSYLQGKLDYHSMNFELLMDHPRPIPEHTDFMAALEEELSKVAHYHELIEVLENQHWGE
jgi:hypothetical protein